MEHEVHEEPKEEKMSPETCVKAGKCLMADMMNKMSLDDYKKLPDEEKDKVDEKEVLGEEEKE